MKTNTYSKKLSTRTLLVLVAGLLALAACDVPGAPAQQPTAATTAAAPSPAATLVPATPTTVPATATTAPPPATATPGVASVLLTATAMPTPAPATATALLPPPTPAPALSPFGVAVRSELFNEGVHALLAEAGVRWARTSVTWQSIEPNPGVYKWESVDQQMIALSNVPAQGLVYIALNPSWAAASVCGPINRANLPDFGRFVAALAGRYNGSTIVNGRTLPAVTYWQFYNEPDNQWTSGDGAGYGGCWGAAGAEYAQMLAVAWTAVHTANPSAKVLFGGIAGEQVDCPQYWACSGQPIFNSSQAGGDFVDDALSYMKANPSSTYFDIFDFHYYPAFHSAWDSYGAGLRGKAEYYKARLAKWGIQRPLICTETGRRSDAVQVIDNLPGSDEEQSRYVVKLYVQGLSSGLLNIMWFTLVDVSDGKQDGVTGWGLLTQALKPKRSYSAYKTLVSQLDNASFKEISPLGAGIESYRFAAASGDILVVWATGPSARASISARSLAVTDMWGAQATVVDGGPQDADQKANGVVALSLTQSPLYVRIGQ